jgi:ABC-type uncharacterized transport system involved in gliding motility auxiliary subunit
MKRDWRHLASPLYWAALAFVLAVGGWYVVNRRIDVVAWVGLGAAAVALVAAMALDPDRLRAALTGRQARYGSNTVLISLGFVGILVVINYLVYANPLSADLTEDREYTLAPESDLALASLPEPAVLQAFYSSDLRSSRESLRPLLERYRAASDGKVTFSFIDPVENPLLARQLGIERDGSLAVVMGDRSEVITYPTEEEITGALVRLSNPEARVIYMLTGHGERDIEDTAETGFSQVRIALESKNYTVNTLNLLSDPNVPADALAVIVAGSVYPLSAAEITALSTYVEAGGSLVVLLQPNVETEMAGRADPLVDYLTGQWGVVAEDDLVVEPRSSSFLVAVSFGYGQSPITSRMGNLASLYPGARSLSPADVEGLTETDLVTTSDLAWGEMDAGFLETQTLPEFDEAVDLPGPLVLAVTVENASSGARLVVIGDSDFASNSWVQQYGNEDLLVNSIDWAAEQENLINLTPRAQTERYVVPPSVQVQGLILLTTVILIPGAVVVAGIAVWLRRRKQA